MPRPACEHLHGSILTLYKNSSVDSDSSEHDILWASVVMYVLRSHTQWSVTGEALLGLSSLPFYGNSSRMLCAVDLSAWAHVISRGCLIQLWIIFGFLLYGICWARHSGHHTEQEILPLMLCLKGKVKGYLASRLPTEWTIIFAWPMKMKQEDTKGPGALAHLVSGDQQCLSDFHVTRTFKAPTSLPALSKIQL